EFVAILPECDQDTVEQVCNRLKAAIREHNNHNPEIPLSISVGFAASRPPFKMAELFQQADQNMYRDKLHRKQRLQGTVIFCLLKALEKRDHRAKNHAKRVRHLVTALGAAIGLPEQRLADLRLFGRFHDIGKIGIPGPILHKPGPLAAAEWSLMQRHCEIGHSIALAAPELASVADLILKHHEWWNGQGYPFGLKGEAIPLECRILAISDAYEAMTSDRPYRKAIPVREALKELWRCTETQFDPGLVPQFIRVIEEQR
ncbi:MAG: HD domain-containing protein, partial [Heliobacteriaceae bacterium]|nr:HD domain-containing protein [Heliobacteriaceae bacterium]